MKGTDGLPPYGARALAELLEPETAPAQTLCLWHAALEYARAGREHGDVEAAAQELGASARTYARGGLATFPCVACDAVDAARKRKPDGSR